MAVLSVAQARKYIKGINLSDDQVIELVALMEEIAWLMLKNPTTAPNVQNALQRSKI